MLMGMMEAEPWQARALCANLSPVEADSIFFPGPGGKSKRAERFCGNCPVQGSCLMDALENQLEGFFSGTTEQARREMAQMWGKALRKLDEFMPPEPERKATRSRYLHVQVSQETYAYLDELVDPFN